MITITNERGQQLYVRLKDGYVDVVMTHSGVFEMTAEDARQLRRFLENLG